MDYILAFQDSGQEKTPSWAGDLFSRRKPMRLRVRAAPCFVPPLAGVRHQTPNQPHNQNPDTVMKVTHLVSSMRVGVAAVAFVLLAPALRADQQISAPYLLPMSINAVIDESDCDNS